MASKSSQLHGFPNSHQAKRLPVKLQSLLARRICDLGLQIKGTPLAQQVRGLYRDLAKAGLDNFRPHIYIGDEWFSPEGVPAIAVPFYLADVRLKTLEMKLKREVEGGTAAWCRKLLRHEAGHAFEHAYEIAHCRKWSQRWRRHFGDPDQTYAPDRYKADPLSLDFVQHLPDHYAQSHPDEDFAETFAVCITPNLDWRRRYRHAPIALAKLEFVAALIEYYRDKEPAVTHGPLTYDAQRLRRTLSSHYRAYLQ